MKKKVLFVGLGSIGQRHLRNLQKISSTFDYQIFYLERSSTNSDKILLNDFNVPIITNLSIADHYSITPIYSIEKCIDFDLIFITNPSSLHCRSIQKLLINNKFAKFFVEKPFCTNQSELNELIQIELDSSDVKFFVGYQYRFSSNVLYVKNIIDSAKFGNVVNCSFVNSEYMPKWHPYEDYRKSYAACSDLGGGAILTQIHDIDLASFLFGEIELVSCFANKTSNLDIDVEDSAILLLRSCINAKMPTFPMTVSLDYLGSPPRKNVFITFENGSLFFDIIENNIEIYTRTDSYSEVIKSNETRNDFFVKMLKAFLDFSDGGTNQYCKLSDTIKGLEIALLAKEWSLHEHNRRYTR